MERVVENQRRRVTVPMIGWFAIFAFVFLTLETTSYVFIHYVIPLRVGYLVYQPPILPSKQEYLHYLETRHPLLGWPRVTGLASAVPRSRDVPSHPKRGSECITTYGDSYVWGNEVASVDAWSNRLSQLLECRVGNFGVGSYGTGQAYLRFEANVHDKAPISFLGIYPSNFKRTINQYRHFFGASIFSFKPRFILRDGAVQLQELPTIAYEDLPRFFKHPEKFLKHELFLPGSTFGPVVATFPYTARLIQIALKEEVRNWLRRRPDWSGFIQKGHPSQALEITVSIVSKYMGLCTTRGKKCFLVLFPSRNAYDYYVRSGRLAVQPLLDELDRLKLPYIELTRQFYEGLSGGRICPMLTRPDQCRGHFNPEGNRMVAQFVYDYLSKHGYLQYKAR